jgi:hypothetical protein
MPQSTFADRLHQPLLGAERTLKTSVERENGRGPVAWQPPHMRDEDLVPRQPEYLSDAL